MGRRKPCCRPISCWPERSLKPQIATLSARAEESAIVLLALRAPVAGDLQSHCETRWLASTDEGVGAACRKIAPPSAPHTLRKESTVILPKWEELQSGGQQCPEVMSRPGKRPPRSAKTRRDGDLHRHLFTARTRIGSTGGGRRRRGVAEPILRALCRPRRGSGTTRDLPGGGAP